MQVGKIQTECQLNRNSESLFLLKRSDNSSTCGSVQVNFSPISINLSDSASIDVEKEVVKSFPIFNTDKRFYTPCFILEVDKNRYIDNQAVYYSLHAKKIQELCEQKIVMYLPKPPKNASICCICKVLYQDYLTHVTDPKHKYASNNSQFTQEIQSLCCKYEKQKENTVQSFDQKYRSLKLKKIKKDQILIRNKVSERKVMRVINK